MGKLRFAIFGAGFWAPFQLAAWQEVKGVECVAVCDAVRSKAEAMAARFSVPRVYDSPEKLLSEERLDFVDIITPNETHLEMVLLAASRRVPAICQKPLAGTLADAERMMAACAAAEVPLLVHENWRWQTPIRQVKKILNEGVIGAPARARISCISGVDDYVNQPFLKEMEQLILADMGVHLLDTSRFLFGEAERLYCQTRRVQDDIRGEDLATVMMRMTGGMTVVCEMALARVPVERDYYVQTMIFVEGRKGSLELAPDYWVRVTTTDGTRAWRFPPPRYAWADPLYEVGMASIVPCHANLLQALRGEGRAETTAQDNYQSLRLVHAAYESARTGEAIKL